MVCHRSSTTSTRVSSPLVQTKKVRRDQVQPHQGGCVGCLTWFVRLISKCPKGCIRHFAVAASYDTTVPLATVTVAAATMGKHAYYRTLRKRSAYSGSSRLCMLACMATWLECPTGRGMLANQRAAPSVGAVNDEARPRQGSSPSSHIT
ncbi:hypothetical protein Tco_0265516 [Tanacetum coccineum]